VGNMCLAHGKFGILTLRLLKTSICSIGVDPVWLRCRRPSYRDLYHTISLQQGPILGEFFRRDFSLFL
jgi:hypothetical protein